MLKPATEPLLETGEKKPTLQYAAWAQVRMGKIYIRSLAGLGRYPVP